MDYWTKCLIHYVSRPMTRIYSLDFSLLPDISFFESRPIRIMLPDDLEMKLAVLPQTLERVQGAVMFAGQSTKQSEPWRSAAFLRAALADYCSIEEMQKIDSSTSTHLQLEDMKNPLLHLLELMRHLNIHIKTIRAVPHSVSATWGDQATDLDVFVISNLDANDLAALRNGKHYALPDLQKAVIWFQEAQLHWGAGYLVRVGAESFAHALYAHYKL